ncbi:MAG TPA: hypothetical protein PKO42_02770 [Tenuifilaceae bacterium]|mgnify:FL=1|jgi:hypothetical protein|nr:hypothetical protein [Bacteroidales bacterium]HNY08788.1 hypothetical protein [Tenuifilaceae bacterium]NLI88626.1 hypothetical protein [Bacteroidales bacterium]HOA10021.1 hypothetical protein [Tenuifilaceae bacterium]HOG72422.1 hypothetical protein [Tenuifilaceae bacterium]
MKKALLWIAAIIVTILAAIYQRDTGPTNPKRITYTIEGTTYKAKLPRSGNSTSDCKVSLNLPLTSTATLYFRRYSTQDSFSPIPFIPEDEKTQSAYLPQMPPAAKLEYYIVVNEGNNPMEIMRNSPVVIRYKGDVPAWALIPHILAMFLAMLYSSLAGLAAAFKMESFRKFAIITLVLLLVGGFVLGPIIQFYAFGQAWTGFPLGFDLTDNKTLIALLIWLAAVIANRKHSRPKIVIAAAIVTIVVFSIPHSTKGSELNYETGKVVSGVIMRVP